MSGDKLKKARGRTTGFQMTDEHRLKIKNSNILNMLIRCAEGTVEMSATQANVGLSLLRKVMPDLTYSEVVGKDGGPIKTEEVGSGAAKLAAVLDAIAERSGTAGGTDAG